MECLPDDILRQIFNYLPLTQLLQGFYPLNRRFNSLLFEHSRTYSINFHPSSGENLQPFISEYIDLIDNQIVRINLNGEWPTSSTFLEMAVNDDLLPRFSRLRSLKLESIMDDNHIRVVIFGVKDSCFLENLELVDCVFPSDYFDMIETLNEIWCLSKLSHCSLQVIIRDGVCFISPTKLSRSISHLKITVNNMDTNEFNMLIENTPNLRHFDFQIDSNFNSVTSIQSSNGIDTLKLSLFVDRLDSLSNLLCGFLNIRELTIEIVELSLDGMEWQHMIESYFKHLQKFQLKQSKIIQNSQYGEEIIHQLLNSFKTPFWIREHRWFIQIDWFLSDECSYVYVYTLPYAFCQISFKQLLLSKRTSPEPDPIIPSRQIRRIDIDEHNLPILDSFLTLFPNLHYIRIDSISDLVSLHFLSYLPPYISLEISIAGLVRNENSMDSLIRLNSCIINSSTFPCILTFLAAIKIYAIRLDLQDEQFYNEDQCHQLIETFALCNCQYLSINLLSFHNLIYFLENLPNLRMITIQIPEDYMNTNTIKDQLADIIDHCSNRISYRLKINHDDLNHRKIHVEMK